jgi:uncharacterized protein
MTSNAKFYNETLKKHLGIKEVVEELEKYMRENDKARYEITVGTDSEGTNETQFVTAISVLRVGNGGRYFWTKSQKVFCPTLQDRIYKEAIQSIMFVQELKSRLKDRVGEELFWDKKIIVHLDVGMNGETKKLIDGVVGMVRGYGFDAVIKPYSFGAFVLADRHT